MIITEHRKSRICLDRMITLRDLEGRLYQGRTKNLSLGGVFIANLNQIPAVQTIVEASFELPGDKTITGKAIVLRGITDPEADEPLGASLSFEAFEAGCSEHLASYINKRLSSAETQKIRLKLDTPNVVIPTEAHTIEDRKMPTKCHLPFLRLGSRILVQEAHQTICEGTLVSVSTPQGGVPRINLGVNIAEQVHSDACSLVKTSKTQRFSFGKKCSARQKQPWVKLALVAILSAIVTSGLAFGVPRGSSKCEEEGGNHPPPVRTPRLLSKQARSKQVTSQRRLPELDSVSKPSRAARGEGRGEHRSGLPGLGREHRSATKTPPSDREAGFETESTSHPPTPVVLKAPLVIETNRRQKWKIRQKKRKRLARKYINKAKRAIDRARWHRAGQLIIKALLLDPTNQRAQAILLGSWVKTKKKPGYKKKRYLRAKPIWRKRNKVKRKKMRKLVVTSR